MRCQGVEGEGVAREEVGKVALKLPLAWHCQGGEFDKVAREEGGDDAARGGGEIARNRVRV